MDKVSFGGVTTPVTFQNLISADGGPPEEKHAVITTQEEWEAFFNGNPPQPAPPAGFIVAIGVGERPTTGFRAEVVSADLLTIGIMAGTVTVNYRVVSPAPGIIVADVLTFPFVVASLDLEWAARVTFRRVEESIQKPRMYIVIQRIGGGSCQVIPADYMYPMTHRQVFGPASRSECEQWAAANCGPLADLGL